jgi:trimethylamine--corrinoid protein Co-methyltransferase
MRAVEGIRVDDETLAFDLIKRIGPGGHFVSERHTRRHMRSELYRPQLSDRETRVEWQDKGAKDARNRATEKAREILDGKPRPLLSKQIRDRIKQEIPGIKAAIM